MVDKKSIRDWLNEPIDIRFKIPDILNPIITHDYEFVTLKVTPERNIRNYNNEIIFDALSDLYEPLSKRLGRQKFLSLKLHYKPLPRIYYDILYKPDEVTFYFTVPKEWENLFKQKIDRAWEHSAIEVVQELPKFNIEKTIAAEMTYLRNSVFSMKTDKDDNDPLNDQLTIVDYMKEGDRLRVNLCMEPTSLKDWFDQCDDAYNQIKKGQMPRKPYELLSNKKELFWRTVEVIIRELADVVLGIFDDSGTEYTAPKDPMLEMLMSKGHLSPSTNHKMGSHSFITTIHVLSESDDEQRRDTNLRTVCNSYKSLKQDNELVRQEITGGVLGKRLRDIFERRRIWSPSPNIMSNKECGKLVQLPTAGLQERYPIPNISTREFEIPSILFDSSKGYPFAYYTYKCKESLVHIPYNDPDELCLPTVAIAGMGQGKTKGMAANTALELFLNGFSVIAVDVAKGEMMNEILSVLPKDKLDKVVYLDFSNKDYPIPLDWCEVRLYNQRTAMQRLTSELAYFLKSTADPAGDRTRMYLELAAKTVFSVPGTTIFDIPMVLKSKEHRHKLLAKIDDPGVKAEWMDYETLSDIQQREFYRPVLFRLNTIMGDQALKNILCQPSKTDENNEPLINFRKWMDEGYLVLIKAKKTAFGEQGLNDLMAFITAKVWLAALTRDEDQEYRPCAYILDEPQQYLSGSANHFEQMFTESRKWRLKLFFLFHSWVQLKQSDKDLARLLKSALCHWHIYSTSEEELKEMKAYIKPYDIDEALAVKKHWAINHLRIGGDYCTFIARMLPPPSDRLPNVDNSNIPLDHSMRYGTWYEIVEKELHDKERSLLYALADERRHKK
jgi:hypothetical protein